MKCRCCAAELKIKVIDLGAAPPSNAFNDSQDAPEKHYPLRVWYCTECALAQTDITLFDAKYDELFTHQYPYHSSTSKSWLAHCERFVQDVTEKLKLDQNSLTVEIGSNDGALLQYVKTPRYGVEPTATGDKAQAKGIETYHNFFGTQLATNLVGLKGQADLIIANNVLAHVPDINDFVRAFSILLKKDGVATFEFPGLVQLIKNCAFDTIYHEHYSYLSLTSVGNIFGRNGLQVFHVEHLPTHGGSLRVWAQRKDGPRKIEDSVANILLEEWELSFPIQFFGDFQARADACKDMLLSLLLSLKRTGKRVGGFGAAAKGNTLLNYAGIRADLIPYIVDDTPAKQGKFCPGSRIPVYPNFPEEPDCVIVFPWNFKAEIREKLKHMKSSLVFPIPILEILASAREEELEVHN